MRRSLALAAFFLFAFMLVAGCVQKSASEKSLGKLDSQKQGVTISPTAVQSQPETGQAGSDEQDSSPENTGLERIEEPVLPGDSEEPPVLPE